MHDIYFIEIYTELIVIVGRYMVYYILYLLFKIKTIGHFNVILYVNSGYNSH